MRYITTTLFFGALLGATAVAAQEAQPSSSAPRDGVAEVEAIDEVIVTGRARRLYRAGVSDTAKLSTDPLSSAQLITSINAQLILDQGARDAQDIYRNISGVSLFSYAGVTARGFRQEEIYFDGLRGDPYVGFNVPQLFNIERVDFLKGPAGMLYGPGEPGGLFNYVTKKPNADGGSRARVMLGEDARYGVSVEANGALPVDGGAGRLGVFYEERDTPRFNTASETGIYDAGLSFELGAATRLTLQATRYEQDLQGNRLRGVVVTDSGDFIADRRWNHNEASDFLNLESNLFQALLDGEIGESISWDVKIRYTDSSQEQQYHEPIQLLDIEALLGQPTDGTPDAVARQWRDQLREEEQLSFGTNWIWSADFGQVRNRLLVGYEYFDGEEEAILGGLNSTPDMIARFLAGASLPTDIVPLSLSNPVYGVTQSQNYATQFRAPRLSGQTFSGAYLLNEATIGRFIAVAGIRFDSFENESGDTGFDDNNNSIRLGLIYRLRDDVSLYAQWAESYQPQSIGTQVPEAGGPFDPTEGIMSEIGIKMELFDGRIQASAAAYEIVRENILQIDPAGDPEGDGIDNFIAFGEVTSKGFEVDVATDLTPNWVLTASYGYNDARITEDNGGGGIRNNVGDRFANAPRHQFGFWTRYQIPAINTALALGGDYVDDRLSLSGQTVKSYTVYDASVIWEPGPVDVLLRVENLFDKTYAESGFLERTGHFPGDPRTVFVEVSREW
ncbi:MAG: TonB-dependent receptor [Pseudomonadota bacterium]